MANRIHSAQVCDASAIAQHRLHEDAMKNSAGNKIVSIRANLWLIYSSVQFPFLSVHFKPPATISIHAIATWMMNTEKNLSGS